MTRTQYSTVIGGVPDALEGGTERLSREPQHSQDGFERVVLGGLPTIIASREQLAEQMLVDCAQARLSQKRPKTVFSSNGQGLALTRDEPAFKTAMLEADIIHADGQPIVFASRLLTSTPLPERVATTDFFHDAARAGERAGLRFFLFGASEDVNAEAFERCQRLYPGVNWVGRLHGFSGLGDDEICERINAAKPDVVWVALGKPNQEYFCLRNRDKLLGVGWLKTCGGLYDFLAGRKVRAPGWMQKLGMEWLFRLIQEPRRLGMRYFTTNFISAYLLLRHTRNGKDKYFDQ